MAYQEDAPWRVTRQAQAMLGIPVDGVWGARTQSAYAAAPASARNEIDRLLARDNLSAYSVGRVTQQVSAPVSAKVSVQGTKVVKPRVSRRSPVSSPVVNGADVQAVKHSTDDAVKRAQARAPVPTGATADSKRWFTLAALKPVLQQATAGLEHATYDRMERKLNLEAARRSNGGVTEYDSNSENGSYRGLFQMGSAAWQDIQSRLGHGYDKVFDPAINARAAALYIENNVRTARKLGYTGPITDAVIYSMHNQGVSGFMRLRDGGSIQGKQSPAAMRVIAEATQAGKTV